MYKNDKYKIKFRPRLLSILSYIIICSIFGLLSFLYLRMYACLVVLVVMIAFPLFSVFSFLYGIKYLDISLNLSDKKISLYDVFTIGINTKNKSFITYLKAILITEFCNKYYGFSSTLKSVIPIKAKSEFLHHISFDVSRLGLIEVNCKTVEIEDLCGFVCAQFALNLQGNVTVLPNREALDDVVYTGLFGGLSDNEDDTKKGNEYSDTSNIREYIPGDRIKDIHWKLSAKKDVLLVKERIKSCENQLILWFDSSTNPNLNDKIIMMFYSVIYHCISEGILVKTIFYDYNRHMISSFTVNSYSEADECLEKLYECGYGARFDDVLSLLYSENYDINRFIRIGYIDNEIKTVIVDGT